jgi:hypothetical protein
MDFLSDITELYQVAGGALEFTPHIPRNRKTHQVTKDKPPDVDGIRI